MEGKDQDYTNTVQELSDYYDKMCQERHTVGQQKYGELTFLQNNTLEMALEELADMGNYIRYAFIRVSILMMQLEELSQQQGFTSTKKSWNREIGKE